MDKAKQEYRQLTGSEPKNLVVLGDETARKLAEQFAGLCGNLYDRNPREMEFIKVKRTVNGYFVRLIDVHRKKDGDYSGVTLNMKNVLLGEIGPAIQGLNVGDSATYCLKGRNVSEIIRKRQVYLHGIERPSSQGRIEQVLSDEHLTETQFMRYPAFEIKGNDASGYIARFKVMSQYGLHARPAALIAKSNSRFDCDITVMHDDKTVSGKSILGLMTLQASRGSDVIVEAKGADAKPCLEALVRLFEQNFGEE